MIFLNNLKFKRMKLNFEKIVEYEKLKVEIIDDIKKNFGSFFEDLFLNLPQLKSLQIPISYDDYYAELRDCDFSVSALNLDDNWLKNGRYKKNAEILSQQIFRISQLIPEEFMNSVLYGYSFIIIHNNLTIELHE